MYSFDSRTETIFSPYLDFNTRTGPISTYNEPQDPKLTLLYIDYVGLVEVKGCGQVFCTMTVEEKISE